MHGGHLKLALWQYRHQPRLRLLEVLAVFALQKRLPLL